MELEYFKAEHAVQLELRQQLVDAMDALDMVRTATLRARLSRVLLAHLAKEDRYLYPRLQNCGSADTAALATHYHYEMGGLAARWQALMTDWPDARIASDFLSFRATLCPLLNDLEKRIENEDSNLYPRYAAACARNGSPDAIAAE
jgi:hemerythrin-like domain-containing protein